MRVRDLIDDEEYTKERDRLKAEMANLKSEVEKTESRAERWLELTEQVLTSQPTRTQLSSTATFTRSGRS